MAEDDALFAVIDRSVRSSAHLVAGELLSGAKKAAVFRYADRRLAKELDAAKLDLEAVGRSRPGDPVPDLRFLPYQRQDDTKWSEYPHFYIEMPWPGKGINDNAAKLIGHMAKAKSRPRGYVMGVYFCFTAAPPNAHFPPVDVGAFRESEALLKAQMAAGGGTLMFEGEDATVQLQGAAAIMKVMIWR